MTAPDEEGALPPHTPGPGRIGGFEGAGKRWLHYRIVEPPDPRHRLLYLHGIESHGGWFLPAAHLLRERGCASYLLDRRGSGLNRGQTPGDAPSAGVLLEDIRLFRRHLSGGPDVHLVGLSWGGKLALAAAIDDPQAIRSVILITPGLRTRLSLSPSSVAALLLGLLGGGRNSIKLPLEPEMFTDSPELLEFIRRDPLRLRRVTGRFLMASRALDRLIARRIGEIHLPILLILAGKDRIIDNEGVLEVLSHLRPGQLLLRRYEEAIHSIQFDQLEPLAQDMTAFLRQADREGFRWSPSGSSPPAR
jgi:alpha-beta hydrolase superfamily lysophospholipase